MTKKYKKTSKVVHYVVVVHGIGQQRKNETILPVIGQFAAARNNDPDQKNYLSLGKLSSQSKERLWIEYKNIPGSTDSALKKPWIPIVENDSKGDNLRFVDFCWSEVMRDYHEKVGETTKVWSDSLINRLKLRVSLEPKEHKPTQWIVDMMQTLQGGLLFIETAMGLRLPVISQEIFGEFLGDVEMYGDFPHTRGRSVRMFHETMAKVHEGHIKEFPDGSVEPHYTIIARSLGTVMTMDAISYAYANVNSRKNTPQSDSSEKSLLHFPGYDYSYILGEASKAEEEAENNLVEWVDHLCSYVTLGSPIDKYLALWTENYSHLNHTEWMDKSRLDARKNKIQHFNYADEQDPVGHELNILKSTVVWNQLADIQEDIVFSRYAMPGKAHVDYWADNSLFSRILDLSIDHHEQLSAKKEIQLDEVKSKGKPSIKWFKKCVYIQALLISFVVVPIISWLIATFYLNTVLEAVVKNGAGEFPLIAFLIFGLTLYLARTLMKLLLEWRIVSEKSRTRVLCTIDKKGKECLAKDEKVKDYIQGFLNKIIIRWTPVLWAFLFIGVNFLGLDILVPTSVLMLTKVGLFLAFVVSFDIFLLNRKVHKKWKNTRIATEFSQYLGSFNKKMG